MRSNLTAKFLCLALAMCLLTGVCALAEESFTVTFYEENSEESAVLGTQKVKAGGMVEQPDDPQREGYTFLGWYGTPTYRFEFDFATPIRRETSVFARWQNPFVSDERVWYLTGSTNGWNASDNETYLMTRADDANIFTIQAEFRMGDEFQINYGGNWDNQRGAGYLVSVIPEDAIAGGFGLSDSAYKANMKVAAEGLYEIRFDSDLDEISIERLGDIADGAEEQPVTPTLVGTLNNYTLPETVEGSPFALALGDDGLYSIEIGLNAGDEFAVTRYNDWSVQYKAETVDAQASNIELNASGNIRVPERAQYRIALDAQTETVAVVMLGEYEPAEGEPVVAFDVNGEVSAITVRAGARIPRPAAPTQDGALFIGWYLDGAVFPFNEQTCTGDLALTATWLPEGEVDSRSYHVYGTVTSWAKGDTTYTLDKEEGTNIYILEMAFEAGAQFQLLEGGHTENQVSAQCLREYDAEAIGGTGNIEVKQAGTYKLTFDSYARALDIEKIK